MQVVMPTPMPMLTPFPSVLLVKLQVQKEKWNFCQAEKRHEEESSPHARVAGILGKHVCCVRRIYDFRVCLAAGNWPLRATAAGTIHMRHAYRWDKCSETEPSLREPPWKGNNLGYNAACRMPHESDREKRNGN